MVPTRDGSLVVAFVELRVDSDHLIVLKEDTRGSWTVLEDRGYMFQSIEDLSLAVADGYPDSRGNERVYVALEMLQSPRIG